MILDFSKKIYLYVYWGIERLWKESLFTWKENWTGKDAWEGSRVVYKKQDVYKKHLDNWKCKQDVYEKHLDNWKCQFLVYKFLQKNYPAILKQDELDYICMMILHNYGHNVL